MKEISRPFTVHQGRSGPIKDLRDLIAASKGEPLKLPKQCTRDKLLNWWKDDNVLSTKVLDAGLRELP
jgi:hypothetical protein